MKFGEEGNYFQDISWARFQEMQSKEDCRFSKGSNGKDKFGLEILNGSKE